MIKLIPKDEWKPLNANKVMSAWALYIIAQNQRAWDKLPKVQLSVPKDIGIRIKKGAPAPNRKLGKPLFATGRLFRSITFKPQKLTWSNLEIGTNVEYADAHFNGTSQPITDSMRKMWIQKYGLLVRAKQITPIKREFIKVTPKMYEKLGELIYLEWSKGK